MANESKPNKESKQALKFCAFMAICWNVTMSEEIRTVGYDLAQILTTSVFSLSEQQAGCSRDSRARRNVMKATILSHEINTELELRFCHYQASYTIQQTEQFKVSDNGLYLHQELKALQTFYLLWVDLCQSVWTGEVFKIPNFGYQEFNLSIAE